MNNCDAIPHIINKLLKPEEFLQIDVFLSKENNQYDSVCISDPANLQAFGINIELYHELCCAIDETCKRVLNKKEIKENA
jgi:hypothetical protein